MAWDFSKTLDNIVNWIKENAIWIIGALIVGWAIWYFFIRGRGKELKPLNRSEIERENFISRMKLNHTHYKTLYRGGKYLGIVNSLRFTDLNPTQDKAKEKQFIELVYKPPLIDLYLFKIHWFMKEVCVLINTSDVTRDSVENELNINPLVTFDKYLGIYYDRKYSNEFSTYIQIDSQFRTDLENMSSFYYAKAQEQSVIRPEYAHNVLKEEIKLQQEQEKRARATEGGS